MNKNVVMIRSNPVNPYPKLEKMANELINLGYNVHILGWDRDSNYRPKKEIIELKDNNASITRVGIKAKFSGGLKKNFLPLIKFQIFLIKWLIKNRKKYNVIHAYDFDTGFVSSKISKIFKSKFIYDIADFYADSHIMNKGILYKIIKRCEIDVINSSDATIICNEKRKIQIAQSAPKNLYVVHNTPYEFDKKKYMNNEYIFDKNLLKLSYIGVFGESRFLEELIDIVSKRNDCELHIGGYGYGFEEKIISASKLSKNIIFYGKTKYIDTLYIESMCDLNVAMYNPNITNHIYAAPNKFYESLMLGKPIITNKGIGIDEIVSDNRIGVVVEYSKNDFNQKLSFLVNNKNELKQMGNKARQLYESDYSWSAQKNAINELYQKI